MTAANRAEQRLLWTRTALADPHIELLPASSDASFRSYWRGHGDGRSWIVMDAPPDREDIGPWLDIAARIRGAGLQAPEIRAADPALGFVLMADLGHALYLPALAEARVDALYDDAMTALLSMQTSIDSHDLPRYDEARLVAEMELLPTWFLQRHLGYTPECEEWDIIESAFRALSNNALQQPQAFVHRDYHSRNLLIVPDRNPGILDFQDAVHGPITYDLVSLLRDCYIEWPEARVYAWAERYRQRLHASGRDTPDAVDFRRAFDLMGLQRHIKVLGIFCRLWYRDGKAGYLGDLSLVWKYTCTIGRRYPETAALIALLERVLGGRDITRPQP